MGHITLGPLVVSDQGRVHEEGLGGGERAWPQLGKGHCPDGVLLAKGQVGQDKVGGGGVQRDVGVESRPVAVLDVDLVAQQLAWNKSVVGQKLAPSSVG